MIFNQRSIIFIVIAILFAGNVLFASQYYVSLKNVQTKESLLQTYQHNERVLNFAKLFIEKVLKTDSEISFEDRLKLENAVRDINNKDILDQWNAFTGSKTETQAQKEVRNFLKLLLDNVTY